jgi:small subunit ribosomal protein S21
MFWKKFRLLFALSRPIGEKRWVHPRLKSGHYLRSKLGCSALKATELFCLEQKLLEGREVRELPSVVLRPNESQDMLLKRFRKKIVKSGVLSTVRRKRWFISKSELRRVEKKKAIRRIKRRQIGRVSE